MRIQYQLVEDSAVRRQALQRHQEMITVLQKLGFESPVICGERLFPFSYLLLWPVTAMMRSKNETVRSTPFLCLTTAYPLTGHRETMTFALINALGVKFATAFSDGTVVLMSTSARADHLDEAAQYYKFAGPKPVEEAWALHQDKLAGFLKDGKDIQPGLAFDDYIRLSRRESEMESPVLLTKYLSLPLVRALFALLFFAALTLCARLWLLP